MTDRKMNDVGSIYAAASGHPQHPHPAADGGVSPASVIAQVLAKYFSADAGLKALKAAEEVVSVLRREGILRP